MAENKLSWTELRRALADRAGVSEKDANTFLSAMNAQLVEALKQDKQLKINGLGMFKLQAVAPRKSVNVTTGEEIIIEGYNKIAFVPEAGVKELVESTNMKANNENVDPIQKLGEQAEEIKDILGNLGQDPANESVESAPVEAAPVVEPTFVPDPEPTIVPDPEPAYVPPTFSMPDPISDPEPAYVPPTFSIPDSTPEPEGPKDEPKKKKKKESHVMRGLLICLVILLLLALVGYFFFRDQIGGWVDELKVRIHPVEQVEVVEEEPVVVEEESYDYDDLSPERIVAEFEEESASDGEWRESDKAKYPHLIATVPLHEGSRLTLIALRYYGSKTYWPYLFDANRDHIANPNVIDAGTPIRVPRLTKLQLDTTNSLTRAKLDRLHMEAEKAINAGF